MKTVVAITGFDHYGRKRRGERFSVGEQDAASLISRGLAKESAQTSDEVPAPKSGKKNATKKAKAVSDALANPAGS